MAQVSPAVLQAKASEDIFGNVWCDTWVIAHPIALVLVVSKELSVAILNVVVSNAEITGRRVE
jgi:hypothetical protein